MEFKNVDCTEYPNEQDGGGSDISIEDITILVILFHGTVELTEIPRGVYTGKTIDVGNLSSIENLAYLALAPTGLSNIGTNHELHAYRTYFEYEIKKSIKSSLEKIKKRAEELIKENKRDIKKNTIFSICEYCFSYLPMRILSTMRNFLGNLLTNYKFTNNFTVCKSVGAASLSGGNGINILKGGTPNPSLSMSHDMFVLMLNELRLKIKKFDSERVTKLCTEQLSDIKTTNEPELRGYCETLQKTLGNMEERCRSLHVLKGFGTSNLPNFINKHLSYNPKVDGPTAPDGGKNMGVIKLQFSIDGSGKVKCSDTPYVAHDVMKVITPYEPEKYDGVYWSNMEACIQHCTKDDRPRSKTTFVIDLTCSSVLGGSDAVIKQFEHANGYITYPGGGKRIKKKSGSRKKTRRVKNKSRTTRYIRNRRNRLKHNKRTKKSRKTKTSRKH
jgi:hypothetical protein